MIGVESRFYLQAPAAAVPQLDRRVWMRRRRRQSSLFLCLHGHRDKRRRIALPKTLLPLIELPGTHIMRAAVCRNALPTCLLRGHQLTPTLTNYFSVITHDSRMPPTAYSLKMGFTQRSQNASRPEGRGQGEAEPAARREEGQGRVASIRKIETVAGSGDAGPHFHCPRPSSPPVMCCRFATGRSAHPDGRGPMVRRSSLLDLSQTTSDSVMLRSLTNLK